LGPTRPPRHRRPAVKRREKRPILMAVPWCGRWGVMAGVRHCGCGGGHCDRGATDPREVPTGPALRMIMPLTQASIPQRLSQYVKHAHGCSENSDRQEKESGAEASKTPNRQRWALGWSPWGSAPYPATEGTLTGAACMPLSTQATAAWAVRLAGGSTDMGQSYADFWSARQPHLGGQGRPTLGSRVPTSHTGMGARAHRFHPE
jgi:hypothetical protein